MILSKFKIFLLLILLLTLILSAYIAGKQSKPDKQVMFQNILHKHYQRVARNIDTQSVVFIGSSSVQALHNGKIYSNSINLAIGGEQLESTSARLKYYSKIHLSKAVFIAAGFNDVCKYSSTEVFDKFLNLVNEFSLKKPLVLSALQPSKNKHVCTSIEQKIKDYNALLKQYCFNREYCHYVDLPLLIAESATVNDKEGTYYFEQDGIHLNSNGYKLWSDAIKVALIGVLASSSNYSKLNSEVS